MVRPRLLERPWGGALEMARGETGLTALFSFPGKVHDRGQAPHHHRGDLRDGAGGHREGMRAGRVAGGGGSGSQTRSRGALLGFGGGGCCLPGVSVQMGPGSACCATTLCSSGGPPTSPWDPCLSRHYGWPWVSGTLGSGPAFHGGHALCHTGWLLSCGSWDGIRGDLAAPQAWQS